MRVFVLKRLAKSEATTRVRLKALDHILVQTEDARSLRRLGAAQHIFLDLCGAPVRIQQPEEHHCQ